MESRSSSGMRCAIAHSVGLTSRFRLNKQLYDKAHFLDRGIDHVESSSHRSSASTMTDYGSQCTLTTGRIQRSKCRENLFIFLIESSPLVVSR